MTAPMSESELLREYLANRDAPCPGCGYNLRGLAGGVCPECNLRSALSVISREPPWRTWILALAGLWLLPAGALLLLSFLSWASLAEDIHFSGDDYLKFFVTPGALLLGFSAIAAWLAGRQGRSRLAGLKRSVRLKSVVFIWMAAATVYAAWIHWVFP
jgi:hypothetical protein